MRGTGTEKARLLEATGAWEAYADGVASVEVHGVNARITYFKFRVLDGARVMMPVAEIVLPVTACNGSVSKMTHRALVSASGRAVVGDEVGETAH